MTLSVLHGTVTVSTSVGGGVTAGEISGNGTNSAIVTSTLAKINATLTNASGLVYQPGTGYTGPDTLTVLTDDQGNTGSPGALTDSDTVAITVTSDNVAPVNTLPAGPLSASEDVPLALSGFSVADSDAGSGTIQVTFSVLNGTLTVNSGVVGGVTAGEVTGTGTATVLLTSTLTKINATLAHATGLAYQSVLNYSGPDTLTMTSNDQGNTGTGGPKSDTDSLAMTVAPVNDAPVNTLPASPISVVEDGSTVVSGLSVNDVDAGSGSLAVTLIVANGKLTVQTAVAGGVTSITGNGTASVTLTGSRNQINATLANATGLIYLPNANFFGPDTLTMLTNDLGNSGSGGLQSDIDTRAISVEAVNDGPSNTITARAPAHARGSPSGDQRYCHCRHRRRQRPDYDHADRAPWHPGGQHHGGRRGGAGDVIDNGSSSVVLIATLGRINTTLADSGGLLYAPAANYAGPDTLTVLTNDVANIGSPGPLTDTDTIALTVQRIGDIVATGAGKGSLGVVNVFDAETQEKLFSITPYGTSYKDGVTVVLGDSNGDGQADLIVTAPAKSKTQLTQVKVFRASDGVALRSHPFHNRTPFGATSKGGAYLALGDLDSDGNLDLVAGQCAGNQVVALDGGDGQTPLFLGAVRPFGRAFRGGVRVAVGEIDTAAAGLETVVASGPGRKAQVKVLSSIGLPLQTLTFNGRYPGGLYVDVAQLNGAGGMEIVVSAAKGPPRVKIYDGSTKFVLADLNGLALGYSRFLQEGSRRGPGRRQ